MFKQILFSLWVCGASLAGATATDMPFWPGSGAAGEGHGDSDKVSLVYSSTELLSAPHLSDGQITGYVLAKFSYGMEASHGEEDTETVLQISDAYNALVSRGALDVTARGWSESIDDIALELQELINASAGEHAIRRLFITQMDFLSKDEIRANSAARREAIRKD